MSRGFIKLEKPALSANYVWVFKNGKLLTPQNDYSLDASGTGVQLYNKVTSNDKVEVLQFTALTSDPKFGYRIFKDMLNRFHFKRLNKDNEYKLQQPLNYYDSNIQLVDSTGIQEPNKALGVPGVVWIDKERIEYFSVDGNLLRQIRRGTLGTGIKEQYPTATVVQGQGLEDERKNKNTALSEKRAQAVADEIMKQLNVQKAEGDLIIDIEINGRGETLPPNIEKSQTKKNSPERRISRVSMVLGPKILLYN